MSRGEGFFCWEENSYFICYEGKCIFPAPGLCLVCIFLVYIGVYFPGSFWCLVYGIVASNCAPIKSWMNDGGEVSFDRIVSEMAFLLFTFFLKQVFFLIE